MGLSPQALKLEVAALHEAFRMWFLGAHRADPNYHPPYEVFLEDIEVVRPGASAYVIRDDFFKWRAIATRELVEATD